MNISTETLLGRAKVILNLEQYSIRNEPYEVGPINLILPKDRQYILRMLIKKPERRLELPTSLRWTLPLIDKAIQQQKRMGINHPFIYLTVRKGPVTSRTDDEWHVDGFSMKTSHLPEQNYVWIDRKSTEIAFPLVKFPSDFDPLVYNINTFLENRIKEENIRSLSLKTLTILDPYVLHRRPKIEDLLHRCFVRISFTPIEIDDINNTSNPRLKTSYTKNGVEFRDSLLDYDAQNI